MAGDDDNGNGSGRRRSPKRRQMGDDERATVGLERRRAERTRSDWSGGIKVPTDDQFSQDEITEPERVLCREASEVDLEILRRLGISPEEPATMRMIAKILSREHRREVEHISGTKELGRQMDELRQILQTPPNAVTAELQDRVEELERDLVTSRAGFKKIKGVAWAAILAAIGSIGTAAVKLYDSARESGEAEIRLVHVERGLERVERAVDRIRLTPDRNQP